MPEPDRILRMRTVLQRTGLSRSTLYRKMHEGTFPHQLRISQKRDSDFAKSRTAVSLTRGHFGGGGF